MAGFPHMDTQSCDEEFNDFAVRLTRSFLVTFVFSFEVRVSFSEVELPFEPPFPFADRLVG